MKLPSQYQWLSKEPGPNILLEALKLHGTKEIKGVEHNPVILGWAQEIGGWIATFYKEDEIPWCGLFTAICAKRAGFPFNQKALSAKEWLNWGTQVTSPMLGDILVFGREGGGHVGLYVGEDDTAYHVLGGNQSDMVCISRIAKSRFLGARRCTWKHGQPKNVRPVRLAAAGGLSQNEA